MTALAAALEPLLPRVLAAGLHGLRLLPAALLCPLLGGPLVPSTVRLALAFGLGACAWSAGGGAPFAGSDLDLLAAAGRELSVGLALGLVAAMPFEAARAGGRLVDTLRGATLTELHVAPLRQRESATGDLLAQWLVVLAATAGGDRLVVAALLDTFRALPAGASSSAAPLAEAALRCAAGASSSPARWRSAPRRRAASSPPIWPSRSRCGPPHSSRWRRRRSPPALPWDCSLWRSRPPPWAGA